MCCNGPIKSTNQDLFRASANQSLKICLVGDISVGKSSLARRFIGEQEWTSTPTIVVDLHRVEIPLDNGTTIPVILWDTAGQERFGSVAASTLRNCVAVVLVYALNSIGSLHHLVYTWYPLVRKHSPELKEVLIVGNKSDLYHGEEEETMESLLSSFCELLKEEKVRFTLVRFSALRADQESCADLFHAFVRRTTFANPEILSFLE